MGFDPLYHSFRDLLVKFIVYNSIAFHRRPSQQRRLNLPVKLHSDEWLIEQCDHELAERRELLEQEEACQLIMMAR